MTPSEKNNARSLVSGALKRGDLIKKPCEICGDKEVQGHHPDYSKPLDVRWLCKKHHQEHHNKTRLPSNKPKLTSSLRMKKSTHALLKVFAAKKLTTIDGAIQILLKQGGY